MSASPRGTRDGGTGRPSRMPFVVVAVVIGTALSTGWALLLLFPAWRGPNVALHAAVEALGALAALAMGFVLLARRHEPRGAKYVPLSLGFHGMGVIELFHAITPLRAGGVLLRGVASLAGGLGFALVWFEYGVARRPRAWIPVTVTCLAFGTWVLVRPTEAPSMLSVSGEFTLAPTVLKVAAAALFVAGGIACLRDFHRSRALEDQLFATLAFLFAAAETMFVYSKLWDACWWLWHALRLLTYVVVLTYISRGYVRMLEEARLAEVARLLADISHDVKNLLQPEAFSLDLIRADLEKLIARSPAPAAPADAAMRERLGGNIAVILDTRRRLQDRLKELADCVQGLSVPVRFAPCSIELLVNGVFATLRMVAEERGIALRTEGLDELPEARVDERRLYSALYNLINNAIPEVPPGGSITVSGRADPVSITVVVSDTGRGMPEELCAQLFEHRAISLKAGGTGLGLKIVKDVVDAHGGEIRVESLLGVGTTFVIRLPRSPESKPQPSRLP